MPINNWPDGWPTPEPISMPLEVRDIVGALTSKGFRVQNAKHKYFWFYVGNDITSINTKVSHGQREIGDDLISKMSQQTKLRKKEFLALVECTLSGATYLEKMVSAGYVKPRTPPHRLHDGPA